MPQGAANGGSPAAGDDPHPPVTWIDVDTASGHDATMAWYGVRGGVWVDSTITGVTIDGDPWTEPTAGNTRPAPIVHVTGSNLYPWRILVSSMEHSVPVTQFTVRSDGTEVRFALPAMPPGLETGDILAADVTINEATRTGAIPYQVSSVGVPGGDGAAIQSAIHRALPGTRIQLTRFRSYTRTRLTFDIEGVPKKMITLMGWPAEPSAVELYGDEANPVLSLIGNDRTVAVAGVQIREGSPGMFVWEASPIIADCIVEGNVGHHIPPPLDLDTAGGIDIRFDADPVIRRCRFTNNAAAPGADGGGLVVDQATATIEDCLLTDNLADRDGGAVFITATTPGKPVFIGSSRFLCNFALAGGGGAIHLGSFGAAHAFACEIEANYAMQTGGGVHAAATAVLEAGNNVIADNQNGNLAGPLCGREWAALNTTLGGGMYIDAETLPLIEENHFARNRSAVGAAVFVANDADPRIARNCILCNFAVKPLVGAPDGFFAPALYVQGTSFGESAQPDVLNNLLCNNRMVGTSTLAEALRASGIYTGQLGQGTPQFVNNVVCQDPAFQCEDETYVPQGWAVRMANNRFVHIRSNVFFNHLENAGSPICERSAVPGCDGSMLTHGDVVCDACCPLVGDVDDNLYCDPLVDPRACAEVGPGSPAYKSGLTWAPALPASLYRPDLPVSRGFILRDGVLPNPPAPSYPENFVRETGSHAALHDVFGAVGVPVEVLIDVDPVEPSPAMIDGDAAVVSYVTRFTLLDAAGQRVAPGAAGVTLHLPARLPFSADHAIRLFAFNETAGRFEDKGLVASYVDEPERVIVFDGVADLATSVVAVVRRGCPGLRGDFNEDCVVDAWDVAPFVAVLLGQDLNPARVMRADVNADGTADGRDVGAFVAAVLRN